VRRRKCGYTRWSRPASPEAIDVYLFEQDAQHALDDCLRDEPAWRGLLRVEEIELDGTLQSAN
jgi:hypothetical protein